MLLLNFAYNRESTFVQCVYFYKNKFMCQMLSLICQIIVSGLRNPYLLAGADTEFRLWGGDILKTYIQGDDNLLGRINFYTAGKCGTIYSALTISCPPLRIHSLNLLFNVNFRHILYLSYLALYLSCMRKSGSR